MNHESCPLTTAEIEEEASLMLRTDDVAIVIRFDGVVSACYVPDHR